MCILTCHHQHHFTSVVPAPCTTPTLTTTPTPHPQVFLTSSSLPLMPVTAWDDVIFDDGTAGTQSLGMRDALLLDQETIQLGSQHTAVPYGYLTGMRA